MRLSILFATLMFTIFLIKGDKKNFPLFLPTCFLAGLLDLWTDVLTSTYPLWEYNDYSPLIKVSRHFIHPFIGYFYTVYLFLQWLPQKNKLKNMFFYITGWVLFASFTEHVFVRYGELKYVNHWNMYSSILADYILFVIFYFHHIWYKKRITNYFQKGHLR